MRVFRSSNPDGPYLDENGNSAIYTKAASDNAHNNTNGWTGVRLMANYQWSCNKEPFRAQGHNSALMDDDGKLYVIYHTKFDNYWLTKTDTLINGENADMNVDGMINVIDLCVLKSYILYGSDNNYVPDSGDDFIHASLSKHGASLPSQ